MSPLKRKVEKLKRDPRQFLIDTRQYKFLRQNFNIELVKYNPIDLALDLVEKKILKDDKSDNDKTPSKKKGDIKISEYDNFDLVKFKKDYITVGHKKSYIYILDLWRKYPWSIKLIKAQVFLMEQKGDYLGIINFLEEAIEKYNNSIDIRLLYVQSLRKAGIYDIQKTIDIITNILDKQPNNISARYYLCQFLWEAQGISPYLIDNLDFLKKKKDQLSPVQQNFICACQYELGKYTDAYQTYKDIRNRLTRRYFTLEMLHELETTDDSKRISYFNAINKFQTKFEEMIKGSENIAIVGNAPTEIGLGRGESIDNSDLIIRFNNFMTGGDFGKDYGYNTDIWVKGGYYIDIGRRDVSQFKGIIQSGNNPLYRNSSFDNFYLDSKISSIEYTFIPPKVYYELIDKIQTSPSAGLAILYWVFLIKGYVKKEWIYGFSYGSQRNNTSEHYFRNINSGRFYPHNWTKEAEVLNSIII